MTSDAPGARTAAPIVGDPTVIAMAAGFGLLAFAVAAGVPAAALLVGVAASFAAWRREILRWPSVIAAIVAVVLFVPFGRYGLPADLPFGVDLYRITVLVVALLWVSALLADPSVRLRRSPFDIQLAVIVGATLASVAVNQSRVRPLEAVVLKAVILFLSFVVVYYMIVSVVREGRTIERLSKVLVLGAAAVAVFAIVEQRSGFNLFDHVSQVLPLQFEGRVLSERDGLVRAVASAEHPIALGVLFAMTAPIGAAIAFGTSRRWWIPTVVLALGMMSTVSRTPLLVAIGAFVVFFWLRPRDVVRLAPLAIPLILVIKLALPGSIATVKTAFLPEAGLVQQQSKLAREADPLLAGGRVRQLGPSLAEASRTPLFGQGLGTRQSGFDNPLRNSPILDNQWLNLLLSIGIVGVIGWATLVVGAVRKLARASRTRAGPDSWLAVGYAAAIAGFALGMFTYDSLAFGQVTFVFWFVLALSASLVLARNEERVG